MGTAVPQELLHVNGDIQMDGMRMIINAFDGTGTFWFQTASGGNTGLFLAFGGSSGGPAESVWIAPGGNSGVFVSNANRVGIVTTQPAYTLDVAGTIGVNGVAAIDPSGAAIKAYYS